MNRTAVKNLRKTVHRKIDILENIKSEKRTTHTPSYSTWWLRNDSISAQLYARSVKLKVYMHTEWVCNNLEAMCLPHNYYVYIRVTVTCI